MDSNPLVIIQNIAFNGLGKDLEYLNTEGTMVIARNFFKMTLCELPPTIHTLILRKINFFRQRLYLTQEMTTCLGSFNYKL